MKINLTNSFSAITLQLINKMKKKGGVMKNFTMFAATTAIVAFVTLCSFTINKDKKGKNEEAPIKEFKFTDYPANQYSVEIDSYTLSTFLIEHIEVKNKNAEDESLCRGWFRLKQYGKIVNQVYFDNIQPHGSCAGIYLPAIQPRKDYFIASKFGDNDGKLILIKKSGEIEMVKGGEFFLSNDKRFIMTNHNSEEHGFTFYDLNADKILFEGKTEKPLADWYFQDNRFYANVSNSPIVNNKMNLLFYDIIENKPAFKPTVTGYVRLDKKLAKFNDMSKIDNCKCKTSSSRASAE